MGRQHRTSRSLHGRGVGDTLFKWAQKLGLAQDPPEFPGEKHVKGYNFLGPGTNLEARERTGKNKPVNETDRQAFLHDTAYKRANDKFKQTNDVSKLKEDIHAADQIFIDNVNKIPGITAMAAVKAIQAKKLLEEKGLLPLTEFSQSATGVPLASLRDLTAERSGLAHIFPNIPPLHYVQKKTRKVKHGHTSVGGFWPVLIPILTSLATFAAEKLFDYVTKSDKKKAVEGSGLDLKSFNKLDPMLQLFHHVDNMTANKLIDFLHNVSQHIPMNKK